MRADMDRARSTHSLTTACPGVDMSVLSLRMGQGDKKSLRDPKRGHVITLPLS